MDKRGVAFRQIVMITYLVMAVIVVLSLSLRAKYIVSEEEYIDAYSKNIALTVNSMLYSDYDVEVKFRINSLFKIDILDDKVKVSTNNFEKEYDFIPDKNFKIDYKRDGNDLILKKVKK